MHRAPSNTRPVRVILAIAVLALAILTPGAAAYASVAPSHTRAAQDSARATYVVRAGDSLSGIVRRSCGLTAGWTATYAASRSVIGGNPDLIKPGQRLTIACAAAPQSRTGGAKSTAAGWVSPLRSYSLTSCYGMRWGALHRGIDMAARTGTPIRAARAGTVKIAGWRWSGYGIEVVIAHPGGVFTHYAHQSRVAVRVGQRVAAGQIIGYVGATGDATGPHLHFEVMRSLSYGSQINPAPYLRSHGVRVGC